MHRRLGLLVLALGSIVRTIRLVVDVHVATSASSEGPVPVVERAFLEATVERASQIWSQAGITLRLGRVDQLPPGKFLHLWNRWARHGLAKAIPLRNDGTIDVFVVRTVADLGRSWVSLPGVHWHTYGIPGGRYYVILGQRSLGLETLAHELGHYFGVDHSLSRVNIMRPGPDRHDARLSAWQIGHARRRVLYFLQRGMLKQDAGGEPRSPGLLVTSQGNSSPEPVLLYMPRRARSHAP